MTGRGVVCIESARINSRQKMKTDRDWLNTMKAVPCTDCHIRYPHWIMQFDHVGPKSFGVANRVGTIAKDKLMKEIEKCEIVCANCHANRTYTRRVLPQ